MHGPNKFIRPIRRQPLTNNSVRAVKEAIGSRTNLQGHGCEATVSGTGRNLIKLTKSCSKAEKEMRENGGPIRSGSFRLSTDEIGLHEPEERRWNRSRRRRYWKRGGEGHRLRTRSPLHSTETRPCRRGFYLRAACLSSADCRSTSSSFSQQAKMEKMHWVRERAREANFLLSFLLREDSVGF